MSKAQRNTMNGASAACERKFAAMKAAEARFASNSTAVQAAKAEWLAAREFLWKCAAEFAA